MSYQYQNYGFQMPRLTPVNKIFIIILAGLFLLDTLLYLITHISLASILGISLAGPRWPLLFQIFTYPLLVPAGQIMNIIFDSLIIWMIGSSLEERWGSLKYFKFLFWSTLGGSLSYLLIHLILPSTSFLPNTYFVGPTGPCYALLVAYGLLYGDRPLSFMMIFPIKAKYFCLILSILLLYSGLFSLGAKVTWGHLGNMAAGFIYIKFLQGINLNFMSNIFPFKKKKKGKGHLHVVKDDENSPKGPPYWH